LARISYSAGSEQKWRSLTSAMIRSDRDHPLGGAMSRLEGPVLALAVLLARPTAAQFSEQLPKDSLVPGRTVLVTPGASYRAGGLHRLFLGANYRDLWTTPVPAEVLDLTTFAGGLRPIKRGGGMQTRSLRFRGADGREYVVRSVNKDPSPNLPPALRRTLAADVLQDQISAAHPAAPLVVAPILEAVGVLHATPRLVVLPHGEARLGEFEAEFGGMLGTLEERATADPDEEDGFAGATEVIKSDKLLEHLEKGPGQQVDERAFLTARLVDIFLGDWDRHQDQWRWARFGDAKPTRWMPIPHDRDYAFSRYEGLLLGLARTSAPQLVTFGPKYPGMLGLTWNGRDLDRRLLAGLEQPVFDSIAETLQSQLTDAVIEQAVGRLPASFLPIDSLRLARALKHRRDHLPAAARAYYRHLAGEVDVHATDAAETVVAERDGPHTTLTITPAVEGAPATAPSFRRRFKAEETNEVRVFLRGGDDLMLVRGTGKGGVRLRIVAGGGRDEVADSSMGGGVKFYPLGGGDRVLAGRVEVDRRPYRPPAEAAPRDWGNRRLPLSWADIGPDVGLFLGSGVMWTQYGFRKDPFAARYRLRAGWSIGASTGRAEFKAQWQENSGITGELLASISGIEVLRFHGFGNETPISQGAEFYRVSQLEYLLAPAILLPLAPKLSVSAGPLARYSRTDFEEDRFISIARPYGSGKFGMVGGRADLRFDGRDRPAAPTRGGQLRLGGSIYPGVWDVEETFGELHGEATGYLSAMRAPLQPTLALRVGAKRAWGRTPFQEAAYIGGSSTVRLGRQNRFAGHAAVYGSAELRLVLTHFLVLLPGDFGVFGLGDIGRVFLNGEPSDKWHRAAGGGVWIAFLSRANTLSVAVARSEERTGVYLQAGFAY
jgi:hypothetical protein